MRWTYYDIPATADGLNPFKLNNVVLDGVARFNDTRDLVSTAHSDINNFYTGNVAVDVAYTHHHNETTTLDFNGPLYDAADTVNGTEAGKAASTNVQHLGWKTKQNQWQTSADFRVYRRAPNAQFQNQVFQTREEATALYNENAPQKVGYVAGETFWYKDTLINAKLAVAASAIQYNMGSWAKGDANGRGSQYYSTNHGHGSAGSMSVSFKVYSTTTLSFQYFVSSESNYDKISWSSSGTGSNFSGWSGNMGGWATATYNVTPGTYTITFTYSKDGSVNRGDDTAYLRNFSIVNVMV